MHKYKQIKVLGKGGFGCAMLVSPKDRPKEQYVIKEVKLAGLPKKEQDAALKEASMLKSLHHPNIVSYVESFTDGGKLYIVMEYADGGDLAGRINEVKKKNSSMSEDEALNIFVQICLALKHMHDRRIIHRDLKAANVFLMKSGVVKLGDLGIARSLSNSADLAKTQIGTPYYLSPEICCDKPYGRKTDMWAAGVVLYECLALTLPFTATDLPRLVTKILSGIYPPLPSRFSPGVRKIVADLLQRDPKARPTVTQLLKTDVLRERMRSFLTNTLAAREFGQALALTSDLIAAPPSKPVEPAPAPAKQVEKAPTAARAPSPAARAPSPAVREAPMVRPVVMPATKVASAVGPSPGADMKALMDRRKAEAARAEAARAEAVAAAEAYRVAQAKLQQQKLEQQRLEQQKLEAQRAEQQRAAAEADQKARERARALLEAAAEERKRRLAEMVERERRLQKERADRAALMVEKEAADRKKRQEVAKRERERWVEERRKEWVAAAPAPSAGSYDRPAAVAARVEVEVYAPPMRRQASAESLVITADANVPAGASSEASDARKAAAESRHNRVSSSSVQARPSVLVSPASSIGSGGSPPGDPAAQEFRALLADPEFRSFYADFMRRKGVTPSNASARDGVRHSRAGSDVSVEENNSVLSARAAGRPPIAMSRQSSYGSETPASERDYRGFGSEEPPAKPLVRPRSFSGSGIDAEKASEESEYLKALEVARRNYVEERRRLKEQQQANGVVVQSSMARDSIDSAADRRSSSFAPDDKNAVLHAAKERRARSMERQEEKLKEAMREAYLERKMLADAKDKHKQAAILSDRNDEAATDCAPDSLSSPPAKMHASKPDPAAEALKREEELRKAAAEAWAERRALQEKAKKIAMEADAGSVGGDDVDTSVETDMSKGLVIVVEGAKKGSGPPARFLARQKARESAGGASKSSGTNKPPVHAGGERSAPAPRQSAPAIVSRSQSKPTSADATPVSSSAPVTPSSSSASSSVKAAAPAPRASKTDAVVAGGVDAISYASDPVLTVDEEGRQLGPLQMAMLQRKKSKTATAPAPAAATSAKSSAKSEPSAKDGATPTSSPNKAAHLNSPILEAAVSVAQLKRSDSSSNKVDASRPLAVIKSMDAALARKPANGGSAPSSDDDDFYLSAASDALHTAATLRRAGLGVVTTELDASTLEDDSTSALPEEDAQVVRLEVDVADMKDEIEKALALSDGDEEDDDEEDSADATPGASDPYAGLMPSIDTILHGLHAAGLGPGGVDADGNRLAMTMIPEASFEGHDDGYSSDGGKSDSDTDDFNASMNRDEFRPLMIQAASGRVIPKQRAGEAKSDTMVSSASDPSSMTG